MLEIIDGSRPRASQTDLENLLHWSQKLAEIQSHIDRVAPRVIEALGSRQGVEAGAHVAKLGPPVEIAGVRYRALSVDGARVYVSVDGALHHVERAICKIQGGV